MLYRRKQVYMNRFLPKCKLVIVSLSLDRVWLSCDLGRDCSVVYHPICNFVSFFKLLWVPYTCCVTRGLPSLLSTYSTLMLVPMIARGPTQAYEISISADGMHDMSLVYGNKLKVPNHFFNMRTLADVAC